VPIGPKFHPDRDIWAIIETSVKDDGDIEMATMHLSLDSETNADLE
jgi:hypothetical protein